MEPTTFKKLLPSFFAIKLNFHDFQNLKPLENIGNKKMTSIQCLNFSSKETPPKRFAFLFVSPRKCRKCGSAAHLPFSTSNLKPGISEVFFSPNWWRSHESKPWFLVILKNMFTKKRVHIRSYKHMSWNKGKNLKLSRSHQYLIHIKITPWFLLRPTYPTSCLVPCQVTRSVSRGQVFLYQLYTGLFSSFLSLRFVD